MRSSTDTMPALTVWQPWAIFLAMGIKCYETRSWPTKLRGTIAVHAALRWTQRTSDQCRTEPWRSHLRRAGYKIPAQGEPLPFPSDYAPTWGLDLGVIIAVAELTDCRPAREVLAEIGETEAAFGDFGHDRFAFAYRNVRYLPKPVPCPGRQRIFRLPESVQDLVVAQLEEVSL